MNEAGLLRAAYIDGAWDSLMDELDGYMGLEDRADVVRVSRMVENALAEAYDRGAQDALANALVPNNN